MKKVIYTGIVAAFLTTGLSAMLPPSTDQLAQELTTLKNQLQVLNNKLSALSGVQPVLNPQPEVQPGTFATHGLLIFLDDSESGIGFVSSVLITALLQEAGPIVVSASLIANVSKANLPKETDPQKILEHFIAINKGFSDQTVQERSEGREIILSVVRFDVNANKQWVIKKINNSLYLLLPKKYLQSKGINNQSVEAFTPQGAISATEQVLGLKVNHMQTVQVADIKKPLPQPQFADYFMQALPAAIFVTNSEYPAHNKAAIPRWALSINGHGRMNHSITFLSINQFKDFLTFLATKINTKLLFCSSCYITGVNTELVYKDIQKGIDTTYPFTIITDAIPDNVIAHPVLQMYIEQGRLQVKTFVQYRDFLNAVITSDVINYRELAESLVPQLTKSKLSSLPQIKFPGLPWFSVIDSDNVVNIGSILAKTHTGPLDIAEFFAKKGKRAHPLVILLHAQNIPFELIINTRAMPALVSMIPGDVVHHIKKISSTYIVDDVLKSFLTLDKLKPHKIFIIDELEGLFSMLMSKDLGDNRGTLLNVIVDLTQAENNIYFTYNGNVYKRVEPTTGHAVVLADQETQNKYNALLAQYGKQGF